jgi:HTH-type transcriptional regulator / antitoxin HigA
MKEVSDRAMRFLIDQREVKQVQVARATGIAESTISEVLAGKVHLTRAQIGKLAGYFHVAPAVFLPEARQGTDNHGTAGR